MHKRFYITIAIVLLGIAAIQIFGFKELDIKEIDAPTYYVVGKEYYGFAEDEPVKTLLQNTQAMLEDGKFVGNMSVWYFGNPDQNTDSLRIFVGVFSTDSLNAPSDYQQLTIAEGKVLQTALDPSAIFSPTPNKVNEALRAYSQEHNLGNSLYLYAEKYMINEVGKHEIWSEVYVKD